MDTSIVLIKPRAKAKGVEAAFFRFLETQGFTIVAQQPVVFDEALIRLFSPHVRDEHVMPLCEYLTEDVTTAYLVTGPNALDACLALREQIRQQHEVVQPFTYIHASDCQEAAERERRIIFG